MKRNYNIKACRRNSQWRERQRWRAFTAMIMTLWDRHPEKRRHLLRQLDMI